MIRITGTFLDEITHDIPAQNWGEKEWAADFDAMKAVGIDTVILIRAGYRRTATFQSKVLSKQVGIFPVYHDLVDLFLRNAHRCGMDFYFGTYDSGEYWHNGQVEKERDINMAFCEEVVEKYGHHPAFKGWYISHEINAFDDGMMRVYEDLSHHLRSLKPIPILISPYVRGKKQFGQEAIGLKQHEKEWEQVFARISGLVDIVAFQDGQVGYDELDDYLQVNCELARKYSIRSWSNVESFDRDMPIKFPPIPFNKLRFKMERAHEAAVEKLITFEFSHFMSPNACYPSARNLYLRYAEWLKEQELA
jgi:beta-galactosidase GanA